MEGRALEWLRNEGGAPFRVLARNYRCRGGELDLILEESPRDGGGQPELVFIEVRARTRGSSWQTGLESIDVGKLRRLRRCIDHYLAFNYRGRARTLRLDALAWDGERWERFRDLRL